MAYTPDCLYCARSQELQEAMVEVVEWEASIVYLSRDNRYKGRCIVVYKEHLRELFALDEPQRNQYMREVCQVASAIQAGFQPDKIHYAIYGDLVPHLHFHIVPKHKGGAEWGAPFIANPPDKILLTEAEVAECLGILRRHLGVDARP